MERTEINFDDFSTHEVVQLKVILLHNQQRYLAAINTIIHCLTRGLWQVSFYFISLKCLPPFIIRLKLGCYMHVLLWSMIKGRIFLFRFYDSF